MHRLQKRILFDLSGFSASDIGFWGQIWGEVGLMGWWHLRYLLFYDAFVSCVLWAPKLVFNVGEDEHEGFLSCWWWWQRSWRDNHKCPVLFIGQGQCWLKITTFLGLLVTSKIRHNIPLCFLTPLSWTHWEDFGSSFRIRTPASGKFTFLVDEGKSIVYPRTAWSLLWLSIGKKLAKGCEQKMVFLGLVGLWWPSTW